MIDYRKELQTRQQLKDAIATNLDENERNMPLLDGLLSYINKQNAQIEKMRAILLQNPQLARVINAMLNENLTFMQALVRYVSVDFATVEEGSAEYYEILNAEIDRNEQITIEQEIEEELHEKHELQAARIEVFCRQNGIDTADFIQDLNNCIVQPVIDSEITYNDLIAYKIAIDAKILLDGGEQSKELFAERKQSRKTIETTPGIYYTNDGITYKIDGKGKLEVLPVRIKPYEPMFVYTDIFAEGVKKEKPSKWQEIIQTLSYTMPWSELTNADGNMSDDEKAVVILKQCSAVTNFAKKIDEAKSKTLFTLDSVENIKELSKTKALKKAYIEFWRTVAEIFKYNDVDDIDVFKNITVNEVLFPLNN